MPRLRLRISLFKVGNKGRVRDGLHAGGIVSHDVDRARKVGRHVAVAVEPLVVASKATEGRGRSWAGHCSFPVP